MKKIAKIYLPNIYDKKVAALYPEAMEYVLLTKRLSFSCLQRLFKIDIMTTDKLYDRLICDHALMCNSGIKISKKPELCPK